MKCASCKHYTGDEGGEWWCFLSRHRGTPLARKAIALRDEGNGCNQWSPLGINDPHEAKAAAEQLIRRIDAFLLTIPKETK